jgi:CheY-like chemotaxis protein
MMKRVLIVDNDPYVLQLLEAVVRADGHDVAACPGPEEALQQIAARPPDLLISDIMMPTMTGVEMLRRVRAEGFAGRCIMISGLSSRAVAGPALDSGADLVLPKPVDLVELLSHIARLAVSPHPEAAATAAVAGTHAAWALTENTRPWSSESLPRTRSSPPSRFIVAGRSAGPGHGEGGKGRKQGFAGDADEVREDGFSS